MASNSFTTQATTGPGYISVLLDFRLSQLPHLLLLSFHFVVHDSDQERFEKMNGCTFALQISLYGILSIFPDVEL